MVRSGSSARSCRTSTLRSPMISPAPQFRRIPASALALAMALLGAGAGAQGTLRIHHLNVGQGSATFIQGPTGTACLIDGGDFGEGTASVIPRLAALGVTHLDVAI